MQTLIVLCIILKTPLQYLEAEFPQTSRKEMDH